MIHSLTIVCNENLASGLRLAGLSAKGVPNMDECERVIDRALDEQHAEVVVVDKALVDELSDETVELMQESGKPVFVSLPLTTSRGNEDVNVFVRNYVEDLLRKTIGKNLAIPETAG